MARAMRALLVVLALTLSLPATAATVYEGDDLQLHLMGWARAGLQFVAAPELAQPSAGVYVGMARLTGAADYKFGDASARAFVQLEARSGQAQMLDAIAELHLPSAVRWRVGFFRTQLSLDVQTGLPFIPFINRSLLVQRGLVPFRRVGTDLTFNSGGDVEVSLGVFEPGDQTFFNSDNNLVGDWVGRLRLRASDQVVIHAAVLGALLQNGFATTADLGASLAVSEILINIEAMAAFDPAGLTSTGFYLQASRPIETEELPFIVQPSLRVEAAQQNNNNPELRASFGLDAHVRDDRVKVSLNQDVGFRNNQLNFATFLQLQLGF